MAFTSKAVVGAAGEHFVMGELLRRGFIAALAPQGAPNMDILIADANGVMLFCIQVKTRTQKGGDGGWHMGKKHEGISSPSLFYVFVDLGKPDAVAPDYYIVPSKVIAELLPRAHAAWLAHPGQGGRSRNDSEMRRIKPSYRSDCPGNEPVIADGWLDAFRSNWRVFEEGTTSGGA